MPPDDGTTRVADRGVIIQVHRYIFITPVPPELVVHHKCDVHKKRCSSLVPPIGGAIVELQHKNNIFYYRIQANPMCMSVCVCVCACIMLASILPVCISLSSSKEYISTPNSFLRLSIWNVDSKTIMCVYASKKQISVILKTGAHLSKTKASMIIHRSITAPR